MMLKKLTIILLLTFLFLVPLIGDEESTDIDAQRGHVFFQNNDYYSALVFYARSLENGSEDGIVWYRTAYCFEQQYEQDDFTSRLYSISFYYLVRQEPDHAYLEELKSKIDQGISINKFLIRKTRREVAGRIVQPGEKPSRFGFLGKIRDAIKSWIEFFKVATKDKVNTLKRIKRKFSNYGVGDGIKALYRDIGLVFLSWCLLSFFTGILLPFALTAMDRKKNKPRNLFVAYLLWLHWGIFGIHRFYMGQFGMGLLWFITLGGLGFGWLADGFMMPRHFKKVSGDRSTSSASGRSTGQRPSLKRKAETYRSSSSSPTGSGLDEMDLLTET